MLQDQFDDLIGRQTQRKYNPKKEKNHACSEPERTFIRLLSDLRQGTERSTKFYQELSQLAGDPDVKEALEARAFIAEKVLANQDRCFDLIGENP